MPEIDEALIAGVDTLLLDAGNTVIFLDHARLATIGARAGLAADAARLVACEGEAKRRAEEGTLVDVPWRGKESAGAPSWGRMVGTIAHVAGLDLAALPAFLEDAWREHLALNLWCKVPEGLREALAAWRAVGGRVAVVSNSEGMLDELFARLDLARSFDHVMDSGKLGIEKPDPRIFEIAVRACGSAPERALHLGDIYATDIVGARAAHVRTALVDPFGHYDGLHSDVPRVPGAAEVARALTAARR